MQPQNDASSLATSLGHHVFSHDGQDLGTVGEVAGAYFKVDAPMQRDYWLARSDVADLSPEAVVLSFDSSALDQHKRREPGLEPAEDAFGSVTVAPVLSERELLEQRAQMERELADQSARLEPLEPTITEQRPVRELEQIPADHAGFGELAGKTVPYAPALDEQDDDVEDIEEQLEEAFGDPGAAPDPDVIIPKAMSASAGGVVPETADVSPVPGGASSAATSAPLPTPPSLGAVEGPDRGAALGSEGSPYAPAGGRSADATFRQSSPATAPYAPVREQRSPGVAVPDAGDVGHPSHGATLTDTLLAGSIATAAFTVPMYVARAAGLSRADLPMLLGTFVCRPGNGARAIGMVPHLLMSVAAIPVAYRSGFDLLGLHPNVRNGALLSIPHLAGSAAFMSVVGRMNPRAIDPPDLPFEPLQKRLHDEAQAEKMGRVLAPGFAGRKLGWLAPLSLVAGHLLYGAIIGWWLGRRQPAH
jgi:hypothetical protein